MPHIKFKVTKNISPVDLKSKQKNLLHYTDHRRVIKIEYHLSTIDNKGKIKFNKFEQKTDVDVRVVQTTFHHYTMKGPIEMDAILA